MTKIEKGLHGKYNVFKIETGVRISDCFVLRPDKDPAAVIALRAYAEATPNKALARDIWNWIDEDEQMIKMADYDGEPVPEELCTIGRDGIADDFIGCGDCFEGDADCSECVIDKLFKEYAKLTGQMCGKGDEQ